jgi:predicted ATPase
LSRQRTPERDVDAPISRLLSGPFESLRGVVVDRIKVLHRIVTDASEARLTELRAAAELEAQAFLVSPGAFLCRAEHRRASTANDAPASFIA